MSDADKPAPPGLTVEPETDDWNGEPIFNAPGLSSIRYRMADYAGFAAEMLKRLPKQGVPDPTVVGGQAYPLKEVHLDEASSFIPALVRSWAQIGDVLTFYQERIANEGYVETAKQAFSVEALHAGVGVKRGAPPPSATDLAKPVDQVVYRVSPGVAASALIAFTVTDAPNGPIAVTIPAGSPIRSHSTNAGASQTFETSQDLTARLAWNAMAMALAPAPPPPDFDAHGLAVTLAGTQTGLKPGARLLILGAPDATGTMGWAYRIVATVEPNKTLSVTLVTLETQGGAGEGFPLRTPRVLSFARVAPLFGHDAIAFKDQPVDVQLANPALLSGGVQSAAIWSARAWSSLVAGFPSTAIRALIQGGDTTPYLATAKGVYGWSQGAWTTVNQGLLNKDVQDLTLGVEDYLYAGGAGGVARATVPARGWSPLSSGVFLDGSTPYKASLPRGPVKQVATGQLVGVKGQYPSVLVAVALTDEGLWANVMQGDGWWKLGLGQAPPLDDPPLKVGMIAMWGPYLYYSVGAELFRGLVSTATPAIQNAALTSLMGWGFVGDVLDVAFYGDPSQDYLECLVRLDAPGKVAYFVFEANAPAKPSSPSDNAPPPPPPPPGSPAAKSIWAPDATDGLPHPDTGEMLAICAGPTPYYADPAGPRFFGVWTTNQKPPTIGLYAFAFDPISWQLVWWPILMFTQGNALALPSAFDVSSQGSALVVMTPLMAADDWANFTSPNTGVDLVASSYGVTPGTWLMLEEPPEPPSADEPPSAEGRPPLVNAWPVLSSAAGQRNDYALKDKVLNVALDPAGALTTTPWSGFDLRAATAYAVSTSLAQAGPPAPTPQTPQGLQAALSLSDPTLVMSGLIDPPPPVGQDLAISGQRIRYRAARLGGILSPAAVAPLPGPSSMAPARCEAVLPETGAPDPFALVNADILAMAASADGQRIVAGAEEGVFVLRIETGGDTLIETEKAPPGPVTAMETLAGVAGAAGQVVALANGLLYGLVDGENAWVQLGLNMPIAVMARDAHEGLWAAAKTGELYRLPAGASSWEAAPCVRLQQAPSALCVTGEGDVFALVGGQVMVVSAGQTAWRDASANLEKLTVTILAAQPGGPALAGLDGQGVYQWSGQDWTPAFKELPVRRVRALRCASDGRVLVGGYGDGAYVGRAEVWAPVMLGLSNVVADFAIAGPQIFTGLRRQAVLCPPSPSPPVVLGYLGQDEIPDPDGSLSASLDQGLITQALVQAFKNAKATLSDAAVVTQITDLGWTICNGADGLYLLGRRIKAISLGVAPDQLIAASVGHSATTLAAIMHGPAVAQTIFTAELADGRQIPTTVLAGDLIQRPAKPGDAIVAEVAKVSSTTPGADRQTTLITLVAPLANLFDASTLVVNANLVEATQGQTVREVLGSGDAMTALQQFKLSQPPLTFVAAPPPANVKTTLTVLVDNAPWTEVDSLREAGPGDQVYTVTLSPDGGATITFGDGQYGARLPTGSANVSAIYRSGMGPIGDTDAGVLTVMLKPPAGISKATNPIAMTPGEPPESQEGVLQRAPGRLRAAGRLIAREDFAGFIAASAGVAQAATWELDAGGVRLLQITVVGEGAQPLAAGDPLVTYLNAQIAARSAVPPPPVMLQAASVVTFDLVASIWFVAAADPDTTLAAGVAAVASAFSAQTRRLAQPVHAGEIIEVLQAVPGIAGVEIEILHRQGQARSYADVLDAARGRWDPVLLRVEPAELLIARLEGLALNPGGRP